jgi:hypothetical protein
VSASSSRPAIRSGSLQCCQNVAPWASISSLGKGKITGGEVRLVGRVRDDCCVRRSQNLPHNERRVSRSVVMMQRSGVSAPLVWTFARHVFPQSPQNGAIEFSIHHLSCWNKFLMHDVSVKKQINIDLTLLRTCAFFGRGEIGVFQRDDCCFISGSYPNTHVSSSVMMLEVKLESFSACSLRSVQTAMRCSF